MTTNILQAYREQQQQKKQRQPKTRLKQKKRIKCFDCLYSRDYDSEFSHQVIEGRVYCRKWLTVLKCGRARHCEYFEKNEEV